MTARADGGYDLRFSRGSTHLVAGPSGCGKTTRVEAMLREKAELFEDGANVRNVIFCYSAWQSAYDRLTEAGVVTRWVNKLPTNRDFIELVRDFRDGGGSIVVIDDFMGSINDDLEEIIRVSSRHYNATTFVLHQGLFPAQRQARQISLNVKYIHCCKNPRDNMQFGHLARQIRPGDYKWVVDAYHRATQEPYGCFLVDLRQECDPRLRFRSHLLRSEWPMRVWQPSGRAI